MPIERSPARNGALPALNTGEEIRLSEPSTKLYTDSNLQGDGTLHLSNQRIIWLSSQDANAGLAMDYPFVTVHAVSRDPAAWPQPCLYCQLKTEDTANNDEEEEPEVPEVRFVPAKAEHLQQIFTVFSEMSALNPDPQDTQADDDSDEDDDDDEAEIPMQVGMWNAEQDDAAMEDAEEDEVDNKGRVETGVAMEH